MIKLIHHVTISKFPKVFDCFKTNLKSSLYSGPHYNFEILNEKFRSCILQLLYIIQLFQISKKISQNKKSNSLNGYKPKCQRALYDFKATERNP